MAIDGTAGAGKSTTAKEVARQLGFRHLDSGAIYRCATLALLASGRDMDDLGSVSAAEVAGLRVRLDWPDGMMQLSIGDRPVQEDDLRQKAVTEWVSQLSRIPAVRANLLSWQRQAVAPPGLVADGRDIGTVVFPEAQVKVFLTADVGARARRRLAQIGLTEPSPSHLAEEVARLRDRDERDSTRAIAPLKPAEGAVRINTTRLEPAEQAARIVYLVKAALKALS